MSYQYIVHPITYIRTSYGCDPAWCEALHIPLNPDWFEIGQQLEAEFWGWA